MTNFEKIKSMSLEELACFLDGWCACSRCRTMGNDCPPLLDFKMWLKQEATE